MNGPLLSVREDPIAFEIEDRTICELADDRACSVDDALAMLSRALEAIEAACLADPRLIPDHLPRLRDQHERAERVFRAAREHLCDAYAKHTGMSR